MSEEIDLAKCPRCGSDAVLDEEYKQVYCTGCPLSVQDVERDCDYVIRIWNELANDIDRNNLKTTRT